MIYLILLLLQAATLAEKQSTAQPTDKQSTATILEFGG